MNDLVAHFVHNCHIDSFQKIFLLLFLDRHPETEGSSQDFGTFLYLGNLVLMEKIVAELQQAGLIVQVEKGYKLSEKPEVRLYLQIKAQFDEHINMPDFVIERDKIALSVIDEIIENEGVNKDVKV